MVGDTPSPRPPRGPGRRALLVGSGAPALAVGASAWAARSGVGLGSSTTIRVAPPTEPLVAAGDPAAAARAVSQALFISSPAAVVVAQGLAGPALEEAGAVATRAGVPCLVDADGLAEELDRLGCERLVRRGPQDHGWSRAVLDRDELDTLPELDIAPHRAVVVTPDAGMQAAALATVRSALGSGDAVEVVSATDPRADQVVAAVRDDTERSLVLVGDFPDLPSAALAGAARMATTAPQLPGGGVLPFPGRRMIALYGHPGVPGLGLLGEQDVDAAVERARDLAQEYADLVEETVVPAFEIIATIADSSAGADGDYSSEADPETAPVGRRSA